MKNIGYLGAHGHALPQYRDDGHWPQPVAEVPVTPEEIAAWRERTGATCSPKIARLLTTLERDYAITGTAPARSGAPAV